MHINLHESHTHLTLGSKQLKQDTYEQYIMYGRKREIDVHNMCIEYKKERDRYSIE